MPDPDLLFGPVPHQEAIDFIKSKPVVSRDVFNGLLPELKARAFTITGLEGNANVMQAVRDRIADLPAAHDWNAIKKDVADDISPFMVDPHAEGEELAAQEAAAVSRAELLLKTHGFQAYQAAQFQVMDRQRDVLPYWQYLTMEDERVRPEHAALDQIVLPQDSPFWNNHFPPWDWGCRCQVVPISQEDRDDLAKEDTKRPSDHKLVLEGPQATHLEHGTLVRAGRTYDVRSPVQKEGGSGFAWDPSSLHMPLEQIKARYDAPVWSEFEAWARRTPLQQGRQAKTVWEWLGGKSAAPIAPTEPAPRPSLDDFIAAHTARPGMITPAEATKVIEALKQPHGIKVADKVTLAVAPGLGAEWRPFVSSTIQDFLDVIPKPVLDALPRFKAKVATRMGAYELGEYSPSKHMLTISAAALAGDAEKIRRTIFHELAHWMHLHGPPDYQAVIEEHFNLRTAGEAMGQLPNYPRGVTGKKDKFWDTYMGRLYNGIVDGSEIPTMVFELLTDPSKLSTYWNIPIHRETIKTALSVLFP